MRNKPFILLDLKNILCKMNESVEGNGVSFKGNQSTLKQVKLKNSKSAENTSETKILLAGTN